LKTSLEITVVAISFTPTAKLLECLIFQFYTTKAE